MKEISDCPIDESLSIGIDIGIGSCAVAALGPQTIRALKVRCFPVPETDNKKELRNAIRRGHRQMRRQGQRWRQRRNDIARLFATHLPLSLHDVKTRDQFDPWAARSRGLDAPLAAAEFVAALMHIAKRRGFRSGSKKAASGNTAEDGKALKGVAAMTEKAQRYRTPGEMLYRDPEFQGKKRNRPDDYSHTLSRDDTRREAHFLFQAQRQFGQDFATAALEEAFLDVAFYQRPLQSSEHLVGPCTFEKGEKRASAFAPSFERFRYLSKLLSLSVVRGTSGGQPLALRVGASGLRAAADQFGIETKITYKKLRKVLALDEDESFVGVPREKPARGSLWEGADVCVTRGAAAGTCALKKALLSQVGKVEWARLLAEGTLLDSIAFVLTFREEIRQSARGTDESIERGLRDLGVSQALAEAILTAAEKGQFKNFKGAGQFSAKAAKAINPYLEQGCVYSEACAAAGYDATAQSEVRIEDIANPVVRKSLVESLRLYRAVIAYLGARPGRVTIEMARAVGKPPDVRKKIDEAIKTRKGEREKLTEEYLGLVGRDPTDDELVAMQLWKEQSHCCIYSGRTISPQDLDLSRRVLEIDHILPRSRSQDNSYHNKALCLTTMNQAKGNASPYEWLTERPHTEAFDWPEFEAWVEALPGLRGMKKRNLLMRNFAERESDFVARNINDTRYACRVFRAVLESGYRDEPVDAKTGRRRRRVYTRPGAITAIVRRSWGLERLKKDATGKRIGDLHHPLDAAIVAALGNDEALTQRLTRIYQYLEGLGLARRIDNIRPPWDGFAADLEAELSRTMVSRPEQRKLTGEAHEATIRRVRSCANPEGVPTQQVYERKPIEKVTAKDLARMECPERHGDMIAAISSWMKQDKKSRPPYPSMPTKSGEPGPPIRKLRLPDTMKSGLRVRGGIAGNGAMVRVDVFKDERGYWLVPIYVHQVADKRKYPCPPTKACTRRRLPEDWTDVSDAEFQFTLWPWSFVRLIDEHGGTVCEGYYRTTDVNTARISISPHRDSRNEVIQRKGVKLLGKIQKLKVNILGEISECGPEVRRWHGAECT